MKKLTLGLGLLLSVISFTQNDYRQYPFEGDNQLVQIVPTIENREVSMEFIDTMMYRGRLDYDSIATSVINERYKEVLSHYKDCEFKVLDIGVNVWNETKYHYGVRLSFWSEERGRFFSTNLDLYNVEMSFKKGTLKEDLIEVFEQTIIQYDKYEEYSRTHPLEPKEGDEDIRMF